jgi:hypothetical protein
MTTAFHSSKFGSFIRKYCLENKSLSLFSPITLLVLLAIVFTFFLTASGETGYAKNSESETIYKNVVSNGDAIRSVLQ